MKPSAAQLPDNRVPGTSPPESQSIESLRSRGHAKVLAEAERQLRNGVRPFLLDGQNRNAVLSKLDRVLDQMTEFRFDRVALYEVAEAISKAHEIVVEIDRDALKQIGLTTQTRVSAQFKNIRLRSALQWVLRDVDLTYRLDHNRVIITTLEAAEQQLSVRMYQLPPSLRRRFEEMIEVVQMTVVPDIWDRLGGPAMMFQKGEILIVAATDPVHYQAAEIIHRLASAMRVVSPPIPAAQHPSRR